jgi:hypothetical protein
VKIGMGIPDYDKEGRVLRADYGDVTVICVYIPSWYNGGHSSGYKNEILGRFYTFYKQFT